MTLIQKVIQERQTVFFIWKTNASASILDYTHLSTRGFARFVYIGVTQLRKPEEEVLLTPLGELMDQWELHKQFLGIAKPKREVFIEDIIPEGI